MKILLAAQSVKRNIFYTFFLKVSYYFSKHKKGAKWSTVLPQIDIVGPKVAAFGSCSYLALFPWKLIFIITPPKTEEHGPKWPA